MDAKDYKCCQCKKAQAVVFFPCIDPDIPSHPYCKACADKASMELLIRLCERKDFSLDPPAKKRKRN